MFVKSVNSEIIKILFNTKKEQLLLGDLVKVNNIKSGVITQVFKIESSREDSSYNIASVRILFTLKNNKWINWEGNVPSKEYNVEKVTVNEILAHINLNNSTNLVSLGELSLYKKVRISVDSSKFRSPTVIFSDRIAEKENIFNILAQELIKCGNKVVILDFKGEYSQITLANRLEAGKDFKLPLNSRGMEVLYSKTLYDVSTEARAAIENVLLQLQEFVDSDELGFIPFMNFKEIVEVEQKESSVAELVLLKNRLAKIERQGIFADTEEEFGSLRNCLENNDFIITDFSKIPAEWHKYFIEYIISTNITLYNQQFFMLFDINNNNINDTLLDKLLVQGYKSGIKPIISACYDSEFANDLISSAENLILYSAKINLVRLTNFEGYLTKLNPSEALIYGKISNDIPLYVKIDQVASLDDIELDDTKENISQNISFNYEDTAVEKNSVEEITEEDFYSESEEFHSHIETNQVKMPEPVQKEYVEKFVKKMSEKPAPRPVNQSAIQKLEKSLGRSHFSENENNNNAAGFIRQQEPTQPAQPVKEDIDQDLYEIAEEYETKEKIEAGNMNYDDNGFDYYEEEQEEPQLSPAYNDVESSEEAIQLEPVQELIQEEEILPKYEEFYNESVSSQVIEKPDLSNYDSFTPEDNTYEESEISTKLNVPKPDIPIYATEPDIKPSSVIFREGDMVKHEKYGLGTINKVISYGDRQLCSIQFENVGKRLLDPQLAVLEKV